MEPKDLDLTTLLDRILQGESGLYLEVVRRHELSLRGYVASQLYNRAEADDLTQEVFMTAWRDLGNFRRESDFGAWLRGIARHRLLTYFRSQQRRVGAVERFQAEVSLIFEAEIASGPRHDEAGRIEQLTRCISLLPDKLRRVVQAGLGGAGPASMAQELATTVPAVYQLHYRANQLLRECLNKAKTL
ncbi:MAG: sigma-70 family RNA polymerase sigma factor [Opitutales bacterium]|nr:sigma-70 family RNA polymerase sigma factor [Opitutales bacterium]